MRKILYDDNSQQDLMKKGYTKVSLLSQTEVSYLLSEIDKLHPDDKFTPSSEKTFGNTCHFTFLDTNIEYRRKVNNLIREVFSPYVNQILIDYKILTGNLFVKPIGMGNVHAHVHWNYTEKLNDTSITFWCPLVDTNEENGTLQVVEGSHKIMSDINGPAMTFYFDNFIDKIIADYSTPVYAKAGEAVIFDGSLIHWSADNKSDKPRPAIQVDNIPSESIPMVYYNDHSSSDNKFEMVGIEDNFFIEKSLLESFRRAESLKSLGFIKNQNRKITEDEFVQLMKSGDEIRQKIYFHKKEAESIAPPSLISRIKSIFKRF